MRGRLIPSTGALRGSAACRIAAAAAPMAGHMQAAPSPDSSTHHFCRAHEQKASHGFAIADAKPASPVPCGCAAWLHEPCAAGEQPVQQQIWWARASVDRELGLCNRLRWLGPLSPEFREEPQRSNTARARRVCEPEQRARERRRDRLRTCAQVPAAPAGSSLHCSLSSHRRSQSGNQPSTQEPSGGAAGKLGPRHLRSPCTAPCALRCRHARCTWHFCACIRAPIPHA